MRMKQRRLGKLGEKVVLVREETKPEDIHGFFASQGILTSRGGKTSHAAVVARGMGKPCVSGCEELRYRSKRKRSDHRDVIIKEGDFITIDGTRGEVYLGEVPTVDPEVSKDLLTLLNWADEIRTMGVRANADTPEAAIRHGNWEPKGSASAEQRECSMPWIGFPLFRR